MILFKQILLLITLSIVVNATTLKEMIQSGLQNNENIKALNLQNKAKQKTFFSVENIYNPIVTTGINYSKLNLDIRDVQVGSTLSGFVKVDIDLYNGGKNKALKNQKEYEYKSALFSTAISEKELALQIVTLFFQTKTTIQNIKIFQEKSATLKAQYERIKIKYDIKMVTIDEVLKLQSEYETNEYTIQDLEYQKSDLLENLSLLVGKNIVSLDNSTLPRVDDLEFIDSENIEALKIDIKAQRENTKIVSAINKPQLKLQNSLTIYDYSDYNEQFLKDLPDKQNQIMLNLTYNLFDTTSKDKIEVSKLTELASKQKLNYVKNQEKINFKLAKKKLTTTKLKINSLKSAVEMGDTIYDMVKIKYQNGIVDNITYLDALSKKTYNKALYRQALNDYEIAKANYYFSSGVNYKNVLKSW